MAGRSPEKARIAVRVTPRASATRLAGLKGQALSVRVTAPPVEGKANRAACELIAKESGVPKSSVSVVRGEGSRDKLVQIIGLSQSDAEARLGINSQGSLPLP